MMTTDRLTIELTGWMRDQASSEAPAYVEAVIATTRSTRQRRAWHFPSRWLLGARWLPTSWAAAPLAARLAIVALLLLAILGLAVAAGSALPRLLGDGVTASGWRLLDGNRVANFELSAHADIDGGQPRGQYRFSRPDTGYVMRAEVTCVRLFGARAVVGGRIVEATDGKLGGFLVWLDDRSREAGRAEALDQVSFTLIGPDDPMWPLPGVTVPLICPSTDLPPGVEWRPVEGAVVVRDR